MKQWELRGITRDVARKSREWPSYPAMTLDAVRERVEPLRAVIDQLPALIWTTDRALRFTSSIGEGFFALGLAPNQVVGIHLTELFEGAHPLEACSAAHRAALSGKTTSFTLHWAGRNLHANGHPLHDANGTIIGVVGVAVEEQLRAAHEPPRGPQEPAYAGTARRP